MAEKTKENPSGSPLGQFSILNQVIKGIDSLTGYDRFPSDKKKIKKKKEKAKEFRNGGKVDVSNFKGQF
tara:strand:- start:293 stop:499 length:207 start_codon:yes stop_codon:yes gene_type:complete